MLVLVRRRTVLASFGIVAFFAVASVVAPEKTARGADGGIVTIYTASWCGYCKQLQAGLRERGVPFEAVDVDENPGAYAVAKKSAKANGIPLTNVVRGPMQRWIVGADVDAVERAYRGD